MLVVGEGVAERQIAVRLRPGGSPGLVWLGGYRSEMTGTKAEALDAWAAAHDRAFTRFDYSGHGQSGGRFEDGTISRWLEESHRVFEACTEGPQIVVGSSMGGWLALLLAEAMREAAPGRIGGLVLIAPAVDMTRALMWDRMTRANRRQLEQDGILSEPSRHTPEPVPITLGLIRDGDRHLFGDRLIETGCPIHILQGVEDTEVPWSHAVSLVSRLASDDVVLTLVKDGDHRLSRPEDLQRLTAAVEAVTELAADG